jgi:uncharacterized protein YhbP (UPF0306 family)
MELTNVEQVIRDYLPGVIHMSLATCAGGKPWVCEVTVAHDDELNLYFRSVPSTRHCQEIAANPNVAGNIVEQHQLGQPLRGVYFEGRAERLDDVTEDSVVYQKYSQQLKRNPDILEDAKSETGNKFYKITVTGYYLFDMRESRPPKKYHLPWKV